MVSAAYLAFPLALPAESTGIWSLFSPERNLHGIRRLYEKGVAGFYQVTLADRGWRVQPGRTLRWPIEEKNAPVDKILPSMRRDIILAHPPTGRRVIIDTKFNSILTRG